VKPTDIPARSHTGDYYPTRDGLLMITSGNHRQQRRLWTVLGHPELAEGLHTDEHDAILRPLLLTRTADEWEEFFQANHVPASRVRSMPEAVADSQLEHRTILHRFTPEADRVLPVAVPTSPFIYAHGGGPAVDFPPPVLGADTDRVLHDFGLADAEIAALRNDGVIG
jgi:crotonobetainyl-CoA:carnitine CoA-transferase CaiB-like acyl-CoA transferase